MNQSSQPSWIERLDTELQEPALKLYKALMRVSKMKNEVRKTDSDADRVDCATFKLTGEVSRLFL